MLFSWDHQFGEKNLLVKGNPDLGIRSLGYPLLSPEFMRSEAFWLECCWLAAAEVFPETAAPVAGLRVEVELVTAFVLDEEVVGCGCLPPPPARLLLSTPTALHDDSATFFDRTEVR